MKKKFSLLAAAFLLVFQFLPTFKAFAAEGPTVSFSEPSSEATVTVGDTVHLKIAASADVANILWFCSGGGHLAAGYTCPATNSTEGDVAYNATGVYTVGVTVKDSDGKTNSAEITIRVINDRPSIEAVTEDEGNEYEVGSNVVILVSARDAYGTINKLKWGCSDGTSDLLLTSVYNLSTPRKAVNNYRVEVTLPDVETDRFSCGFAAVDDDEEESEPVILALRVVVPTAEENTENSDTPETTDNVVKGSPDTGVATLENGSAGADVSVAAVVASVIVACWIFARANKKEVL